MASVIDTFLVIEAFLDSDTGVTCPLLLFCFLGAAVSVQSSSSLDSSEETFP